MTRPTGRFFELPLTALLQKKKIPINAPYFKIAQIGSEVEIFFEESQGEGEPCSEAGKVFCVDPTNPDEWFTDIYVSNAQAGEGVLRLFISPNIRIDDGPSQASAVTGTTLAHMVAQAVTPAGSAWNVRNIFMSSLSSATDFVAAVSGGGTTLQIERDTAFPAGGTDWLQGARVKTTAAAGAASSGRAYYQNIQIPAIKYLNLRTIGVPPFNGMDNEYWEIDDDVAAFMLNAGGGGRLVVAWGMGQMQPDLGELKGLFVGFYADKASGGLWDAVIYSNPGGAPVFHKRTSLAGYTFNQVRRLLVRIGVIAGSRRVEWEIDGQIVATFSPPVAVDLATNATWSNMFPHFSLADKVDIADVAATWSVLGAGGQVRVYSER